MFLKGKIYLKMTNETGYLEGIGTFCIGTLEVFEDLELFDD